MNDQPLVSYESVQSACEKLISANIKPTVRAVRDALGGGSPNAIADFLRQLRSSESTIIKLDGVAATGTVEIAFARDLFTAKTRVELELKECQIKLHAAEIRAAVAEARLSDALLRIEIIRPWKRPADDDIE